MTRTITLLTLLFTIILLSSCGLGEKEQRTAGDYILRKREVSEQREVLQDPISFNRFHGEGMVSRNGNGVVPDGGELEKNNQRVVYLTFDDGPTENTKGILSVLKEHDAKATFFVNGRESDFAKKVYRDIVNDGHALGNHTYSHEYDFIYSNLDNFKEDFYRLQNLLRETTGETPSYFRFPGGSNSTRATKLGGDSVLREIRSFLENNGYVFFDWNVDSRDSANQNQPKEVIVQETLDQLKNKDTAIVIFHDGYNKESTVEALPAILDQLEEWGFTFKTLSKESPKQHFRM